MLFADITVLEKAEEYSVRFALDWNQKVIHGTIDWCAKNWQSLLAGVVDLAVIFVVCCCLFVLIRRVIVPLVGKWREGVARGLRAISEPLVWLLFWFSFSQSVNYIPFSDGVHHVLDKLFYLCFILVFLSGFQRAVECLATILIERFKKRDPKKYSMNKLLLDLSLSIVRLLAWSFVIMFILQEVFHLKVAHLIASAGIAGLAVAFAAKDTIANIFGAFAILGSKMFQVGDWIKVGATEGSVEQIGFRSVRIRAFDNGRLIDIPNHVIADTQIENFNRHLFWREYYCFALTYDTTPEQMSLAKQILGEVARDLAYLMVAEKSPQFDFTLFDQSSLNLDGYVWFKPTSYLGMRHARGQFNEEVLKRFGAAGLSFAFPTTTVVLEGENKRT